MDARDVDDRGALVVAERLARSETELLALSDTEDVRLAVMLCDALPRALRDEELERVGAFEETAVGLGEPVTENVTADDFV